MTARVKHYEFRPTRTGIKLILWQALERGGKSVLTSAELPGNPKPGNLVRLSKIQAAIPEHLRNSPV